MKYKISLLGYGEELLVGSVSEEGFNHFKNNDISFSDYMSDNMEDDLPLNLREHFTNDISERYDHMNDIVHAYGAYYDDTSHITVTDENGFVVYDFKVVDIATLHTEDLVEEIDFVCEEPRYISIGRIYSKGLHDEFELELAYPEEFDPSKLCVLYNCYDEDIYLICGVKYGDVMLESNGELGTTGKSEDWFLRDNENPLHLI
jgi:hypothetical protein